MGKTYKIERARALNGPPSRPHKEVELISTGMPEYGIRTDTGETVPGRVDNGGTRRGNQRKMRAKMKVDERKKERKVRNRAPLDLDEGE